MKTQKKLITGYLILVLILIAGSVLAQETYILNKSNSSMKVSGTSNVHDWAMDVNNFQGYLFVNHAEDNYEISRVYFKAKAKSILSDKKLMNKKAHEALKVDEHSSITFRLSEVKNLKTTEDKVSGTIQGDLVIAGKTNQIELTFSGKLKDNQIHIQDTYTLNMSDYNVEPPTAMLGSVKTDDKVLVNFDMIFSMKNVES